MSDEAEAIRQRYERRRTTAAGKYPPLAPVNLAFAHERQRVMAGLLREAGFDGLNGLDILEVGCGGGRNIVELVMLGATPSRLVGSDLMADRIAAARRRVPEAVRLDVGESSTFGYPEDSFDIVMQSLVFTSIFDDDLQEELARRMWRWTRPGGGVLWYDFIYDNPSNPDVRRIPLARVRELFPDGDMTVRRLTLAPPLARAACRIAPALYGILNLLPFLRTHVMCWIAKPAE